jgi:hypothetical protein
MLGVLGYAEKREAIRSGRSNPHMRSIEFGKKLELFFN